MFLLIGATIRFMESEKRANVQCEILVRGERRQRCLLLPMSVIEERPNGILVPDWLIRKEQQKYKHMFGTLPDFVAEKID